jgi:hypothetical protein
MAVKTKKKVVKKRRFKASDTIDPVKDAHKYFNLQKVIEQTCIQPDKIYNNMKGLYNSLTLEERKQIATCLMIPVANIFERLGMKVTFSPLENEAEPMVVDFDADADADLNEL